MISSKKIIIKKKEFTIFLLYLILLTIIMIFHEPWFDEAEAWLIARDATLIELFGKVLHYEGHPPLWYLALMPFAKSGLPYEFGLKFVSFIFASISAYLIIFKSPFPKIIRLILPFTYFLFYQYGVVSREYSLMMVAFWLTAITFKKRNIKPWDFILSLIILCGSSAFGILITLGIVIVWVSEIIKEIKVKNIKKDSLFLIFKDKRFIPLLFLFMINLVFAGMMLPAKDKVTDFAKLSDYIQRFIYITFIAPSDAVFSSVAQVYNLRITIEFTSYIFFIGVYGIIILISMFLFTKRRSLHYYFIIPNILLIFFATFIYFSPHHVGIITLFYIFLLWISLESNNIVHTNDFYKRTFTKVDKIKFCKAAKMIGILAVGAIIFTQIWWSIDSSIADIKYTYNSAREIAQFIKENKLDDYTILNRWQNRKNEDNVIIENCENQDISVLPYFNKNIFYNLNLGNRNVSYDTHKKVDNYKTKQEWAKHGLPDFILGDSSCFDNSIAGLDIKLYIPVKVFKQITIWKMEQPYDFPYPTYYLFIRKDLMAKFHQFKEIDTKDIIVN